MPAVTFDEVMDESDKGVAKLTQEIVSLLPTAYPALSISNSSGTSFRLPGDFVSLKARLSTMPNTPRSFWNG